MPVQDRVVSVHPYWKVFDGKMNEFQALCERFMAAVAREPKCLHFGFSFNGDEAFCREAYDGAEGVLEHVANVGPLLTDAMQLARIARVEVHGIEEELA